MEARIRDLQERIAFCRKVLREIELLSQRYNRQIAEAEEDLRRLQKADAVEHRSLDLTDK